MPGSMYGACRRLTAHDAHGLPVGNGGVSVAPHAGQGVTHPHCEILALAERRGIRDVRVFGSMARGDADETSEVDLLVTLPPGRTGPALGELLELLSRPMG